MTFFMLVVLQLFIIDLIESQKEGDLRVSDGNNSREGRLEVYHNKYWGTICSQGFDTLDALVACRQLTNRNEKNASYYSTRGGTTGYVWMAGLDCSGRESKLSNCTHAGWGNTACKHSKVVAVRCYLANEGDLRVADGSDITEGRLDIYHNGRWGTICGVGFDSLDALVACRQLTNGNERAASYYTGANGTGVIWMDNLSCSGKELDVNGCSHGRWGDNDCDHDQDVGIRCVVANEGDLRVTDGRNSRDGRLEIYHKGSWGTICSDGFGRHEAIVACRQLTKRNVEDVSYFIAGGGTGSIWIKELLCTGTELNLASCVKDEMRDHNCSHGNDVGVICNVEYEGDLRLSDGNNSREGRLEIYHNEEWGTVCIDKFGTLDALVACRQLTHGNVEVASYYYASGGNDSIWIDDPGCIGSEWRLDTCVNHKWGGNNCDHSEDVGIRCFVADEDVNIDRSSVFNENHNKDKKWNSAFIAALPSLIMKCYERYDVTGSSVIALFGDLRVADGNRSRDGRLEVYHDGRWGTVCNKGFGISDAFVACRQLTNRNVKDVSFYTVGGGTGTIWISNLACKGKETALHECINDGLWGYHDCNHDQDVGIQCFEATEGDLRVSDGSNSEEGRLEIYYKRRWGTVCQDGFDAMDAFVACRQLTNRNVKSAYFYTAGDGTGIIWLNNLACNGSEWRLNNCPHGHWGIHNCDHEKDVGIRCHIANEGDLRLSDGKESTDGRLEIYHSGQWGTICKGSFGTLDALVACRQLTNRNVLKSSYYTADGGTGTIWMNNLGCNGGERTLTQCPHDGWAGHHCNHDEDVGIRCFINETNGLRVSGGNTSRDGRLEIFNNGRWGTICDDGFDSLDALVACRQLTNRNVMNVSYYTTGGGAGDIWMDELDCIGTERTLDECSHDGWGYHNCKHDEDVGIHCHVETTGDLRLTGDNNSRRGRLEIYMNGRWGTICDDEFDTLDALVACRQILNRNVRKASNFNAGNGTGTIWMSKLACTGTEWKLLDCSHNKLGNHHCSHNNDVGISCFIENEGDLRVSDGSNSTHGRLEIFHNEKWGTTCNDNFDELDALVACRQLTNRNVKSFNFFTVGDGTGNIWLHKLDCNGSELQLNECPHRGFGVNLCGHDEDVGIQCNIDSEVQGYWGSWSSWSVCRNACYNGYRKKIRYCDNPGPSTGRLYCLGASFYIETCREGLCELILYIAMGVEAMAILITVLVVYLWETYKERRQMTRHQDTANIGQRRQSQPTQNEYREEYDLPTDNAESKSCGIATSAV